MENRYSNFHHVIDEDPLKVGDVVVVDLKDSYAHAWVGKVCDPRGDVTNTDYRVTYRINIKFPGFVAPREFAYSDCRLANTADKKHYFLEALRRGRKV